MEGELLLPLYLYRFIRLDFVTINLVVILDYTIIILGGLIMYGTVTKYFQDKGFGFIRGNDGNSYFIHHSNLGGEYLEQGYYVFFRTFQNDRSDYNAGNVIVV